MKYNSNVRHFHYYEWRFYSGGGTYGDTMASLSLKHVKHGTQNIHKMIATSVFLTALECTKFDFSWGDWGSAPHPRWGSLQCSPRPPGWFKGPTTKGGRGERREEGGKTERKGKGGKGTVPPYANSWIRPCSPKPLVFLQTNGE